jgi:hypothetical protein
MEYGRKYGMGGNVDRLRMAFGGRMRYAEEGVSVEQGDPKKPTFFVASGNDNRGEYPTGHEIAAIFVRTPQGPKQLDPRDLLEMFPEAKGDMMKAYEMAGINAVAPPGAEGKSVLFPDIIEPRYNMALKNEFGVENLAELRKKLNIAPVDYNRERDLPHVIDSIRTPGSLS